jgi:hypothetical protein
MQSASALATAASEHAKPWISTLRELYPYPSIYMGLNVKEQLQLGSVYANEHVQDDIASLELSGGLAGRTEISKLVEAAQKATEFDDQDVLHAMRWAVASLL